MVRDVGAIDFLWHGVRDGLLMAWQVWWALVLGFAISAMVQAWSPGPGSRPRSAARARPR